MKLGMAVQFYILQVSVVSYLHFDHYSCDTFKCTTGAELGIIKETVYVGYTGIIKASYRKCIRWIMDF